MDVDGNRYTNPGSINNREIPGRNTHEDRSNEEKPALRNWTIRVYIWETEERLG